MLEEHIEILKQNLLFLMAEHKLENFTQIIIVKRELDKAVQERMKLSQVYVISFFVSCSYNYYRSIIKKEMHDLAIVRG